MCIHVHLYIYIHMFLWMCIHVYIYIHIYTSLSSSINIIITTLHRANTSETLTYRNAEQFFTIECTGDIVVGDTILMTEV
jgi:hypothetical protein